MRSERFLFVSVLVALVCLNALPAAKAQSATQSITLQPGWNSVYLAVQPSNNAANAVFGGLPVASVWTRAERLSSVDYIQNASEATFNQAGWLGWFHPSRPEAFLNNLHSVQANRAYLINCTNATPVVWSLTGRPSLRQPEWVPDVYNLRGLPVDPAAPPTFLNFFRYSKAHFNPTNGLLEKIYRLNVSGQWAQVASNDFTRAGEAYWIFTRGASDYVAPLQAGLELGDGFDFGNELTELQLRLKNLTAGPMSATVQDLGGTTALSYFQLSPTLGGQWVSLPSPLMLSTGAGAEVRPRIGLRRQHVPGSGYATVLEIKNGLGVRFLVPVSASKDTVASGINPLAGLWVGSATINGVSEVNSTSTNPTPTKSEMNLRLLIHVAANGQARLLKEVIQMWRNGTYTNNANGDRVADTPGEYVLLTDDTLIPQFGGAVLRDGAAVGRRISTVGYDFPSTTTNNFLNLTGTFAVGQKLTGTLAMPYDAPTNPFMHKFHPDHDNLNARFDGPAIESYPTSRQIELSFASSPPAGGAVTADFGYNLMGGTYRETMTGLHKKAINVSGTFRLNRVSQIAQLNPSPTP